MYVSECAPAKHRGRSVAIQLSIVIFGTIVTYWLDYGTIKNLTGEVVWRFPSLFRTSSLSSQYSLCRSSQRRPGGCVPTIAGKKLSASWPDYKGPPSTIRTCG